MSSQASEPARTARHNAMLVRWPRACTDRSPRRADLSRSHLLWARSGRRSYNSRDWCRAATPGSCCATTATAWSSARPKSSPTPAAPTSLPCKAVSQRGESRPRAVLRCQRAEQGVWRAHRAACHTPSVSAEELDGLMRSGADMVVVDSRPFDEFQRVSNSRRHQCAWRRARPAITTSRLHRKRWWSSIAPALPAAYRRAIADQRRAAEQGRGAAQRHHGMDAGGPDARQRQDPALHRAVQRRPRFCQIGGRSGRQAVRRHAHRCQGAGELPRRHDRTPMCSTCAIRPTTPPAIFPARSTRRAASLSRPPINMPPRSARGSC